MHQADLDFTARHSRTTDPPTSMEAATKARVMALAHCRIIEGVLREADMPLGSQEISDRCELGYVQVARRMSDLANTNPPVVRRSPGPMYVSPSGRKGVRWELVGE